MLFALLLALAPQQAGLQSCSYPSRAADDIVTVGHCASLDAAGRIHVARNILARMAFDRRGLSEVNVDRGWYLVRRNGISRRVMTMDGMAEEPADGLYRSPVGTRIGYIDRSLRLVIPARYDGAYMFDHGRAAVCIGCQDATDGEHRWYRGGRWACIGRNGRTVVPFRTAEPAESLSGICDHRTSR